MFRTGAARLCRWLARLALVVVVAEEEEGGGGGRGGGGGGTGTGIPGDDGGPTSSSGVAPKWETVYVVSDEWV
jgi:hypothetical protein